MVSTSLHDSPDQRPADGAATPFHSLDEFVALPRMSGLKLSPDGTRLVVGVSTPDPKGHRYQSSLWRVDPLGVDPAVRVTRGASGESSATFTHTGDLLFTAKRTDPDDAEATDRAPLWLLPAGLGEARVVASRIGGFAGVQAARNAPGVLLTCSLLPAATDPADDDELRKARKDAGISAILHDGYPVRYWDHDLGPDRPHLLAADLTAATGDLPAAATSADGTASGRLVLRDLTPEPGGALREQSADLSSDGTSVVTGWHRPVGAGDQRSVICLIDVVSGERRVLREEPHAELYGPLFSPDGTRVVYVREECSTPELAPRMGLEVVDVRDGTVSTPSAGWDRWPADVVWTADGNGLLVAADQNGRSPVFLLDLAGGVRQLTDDDASYTELVVSPDGAWLYAMRTSYLAPAHPVRISLTGADAGDVLALPAPAPHPGLPGTLLDVSAATSDGAGVRGWLALPHGADADHPVPLLLWIHGGPLNSWNSWSWRWTPWIMVAAGYAVLLPDPALSTGYGQDYIQRGWGAWGGAPFTDLMAITDEVQAREDIDATRTAAMGGSFGGYMANWVAGHTDRFRAIVTHASLWSLDEFGPTTDSAHYWGREMSASMTAANSPHLFVSSINTPMLVVHGDKDYRVPIGQGIRLWYDLLSKSGLPADADGRSPHRFLYFPTENHWVLTPGHAKVWYEVVLGFLAEHVLGAGAAPVPSLLGGPPAVGATGD